MYVPGMVTRPVILVHGVSSARPVLRKITQTESPGPGLTDMHWAAEIGIIRQGRMRRRSGSWSAEFGPGDLYLQGMWEVQSAEVLVAPLDMVMLHIHPPLLANLVFPEGPSANWLAWFTAPPERRPRAPAGSAAQWLAFAERIATLDVSDQWQDGAQMRLLLMDLLLALSRIQLPPPPGIRTSNVDGEGIGPALGLAFAARGSVTLAKAASACRMGSERFDHTFRQLMGMSFARFLLGYRLQGAAQALRDEGTPVKRIAVEWGFTDASHLHRHFHRVYGMAPQAWRTQKSHH